VGVRGAARGDLSLEHRRKREEARVLNPGFVTDKQTVERAERANSKFSVTRVCR
jgi:hypothetical protein